MGQLITRTPEKFWNRGKYRFTNKVVISKKSFLDSRGFPYDPYSIMHYSVGDFSRNGEDTIRFKDPSVDLINVG